MNGKPGVLAVMELAYRNLNGGGDTLSIAEFRAAHEGMKEARATVERLAEKADAVLWKLNRNEDSGPAKIDRNDVVIRQLVAALAAFKGEQP